MRIQHKSQYEKCIPVELLSQKNYVPMASSVKVLCSELFLLLLTEYSNEKSLSKSLMYIPKVGNVLTNSFSILYQGKRCLKAIYNYISSYSSQHPNKCFLWHLSSSYPLAIKECKKIGNEQQNIVLPKCVSQSLHLKVTY